MDKATHQKVISNISKKEEEDKKMQEIQKKEDFEASQWAKPPDMHKQVHGITEIKFKK